MKSTRTLAPAATLSLAGTRALAAVLLAACAPRAAAICATMPAPQPTSR